MTDHASIKCAHCLGQHLTKDHQIATGEAPTSNLRIIERLRAVGLDSRLATDAADEIEWLCVALAKADALARLTRSFAGDAGLNYEHQLWDAGGNWGKVPAEVVAISLTGKRIRIRCRPPREQCDRMPYVTPTKLTHQTRPEHE